jgi:predicted DCC family thiol-disulfide oxidoreductase YuxK
MWWLAPIMHVPGIMVLARPAYAWVSRNRYRLMGKVEECDNGACQIHRK